MKKLLSILVLAVIFTSCKQGKTGEEQTKVVMVQDTSAFYNNSIANDKANDQQKYGAKAGSAFESLPTKKHNNSSSNSTATNNKNQATTSTTSSNSTASNTVPQKKKGWSHRAKGTVVGAGTGAITGALINKNNRAVGALAGAAIGAATGYIIGNEVDKKKGR